MRAEVLMRAAELLGLAVEHYREAITPPSGATPASAPPITVPAAAKPSTPTEAAQAAMVH